MLFFLFFRFVLPFLIRAFNPFWFFMIPITYFWGYHAEFQLAHFLFWVKCNNFACLCWCRGRCSCVIEKSLCRPYSSFFYRSSIRNPHTIFIVFTSLFYARSILYIILECCPKFSLQLLCIFSHFERQNLKSEPLAKLVGTIFPSWPSNFLKCFCVHFVHVLGLNLVSEPEKSKKSCLLILPWAQ